MPRGGFFRTGWVETLGVLRPMESGVPRMETGSVETGLPSVETGHRRLGTGGGWARSGLRQARIR
jgi:hypothetical protein